MQQTKFRASLRKCQRTEEDKDVTEKMVVYRNDHGSLICALLVLELNCEFKVSPTIR